MSSTMMALCTAEAVRPLALNRLPRLAMEMPGTFLVISQEIAMKVFGMSSSRPIVSDDNNGHER